MAGWIWIGLISLLIHLEVVSGTLTVIHGRVTSQGVALETVEGVAVLNLGGPVTSHYFDCHTDVGAPEDLVWSREGDTQRFPTSVIDIVFDEVPLRTLRMDMAPLGAPVGYPDVDIYTCSDTETGESTSVNITGGATAVCVVESSYDINLGGIAELRVYEAGDPPIASEEIIWRGPDGQEVMNVEGKTSLHDKNTRLVIRNIELADSGTYTISVEREISLGVYRTFASTATELNVHVPSMVTTNPTSMEILEHNSITFTCVVTGNPSPDVTWEREGSEPLPGTVRRNIIRVSEMSENYTLYTVTSNFTITEVLFEDQGRYRCVASNTVTGGAMRTDSSSLAELTVTPRLQLEATPPGILTQGSLGSSLLRTTLGSRVQLDCSGSGNLNWELQSGAAIEVNTGIDPDVNRYQQFDFSNLVQRLIIQVFSEAESDLYTCTSDLLVNGIEGVIATSVLITSADPVVYFPERTEYARSGSRAVLEASLYTSSSSNPTVQWYYQGSLIDTANSERYSTPEEEEDNRLSLSVESVDTDVLGMYTVSVTIGGTTENATVTLEFPVPPTVTILPSSRGVSEAESATFQCIGGGTESTVRWGLIGGQPLPAGVTQEGDNLVISQASRDHAGMYECRVTNTADTVTSSALLTVFYAPTAIITREGTPQTSISNQLLQVTAEQDDPAPTFSCSSDGIPEPTLTWLGLEGDLTLPSGVTRHSPSDRNSLDLVWGRGLLYTDSGRYTCNAVNSNGSSEATLELLVRVPPTITSIFPRSPVNTSTTTSSTYIVPLGYSGTVITCAAYGWPTPSIEWQRNGASLPGLSDSDSESNSAFVSARLRWTNEFQEADAGTYTCVVHANDTNLVQTKVITLEAGVGVPPTIVPEVCSIGSRDVLFEIRVLDSDCRTWGDGLRQHIAGNFLNDIMNAVTAECRDCIVSAENVVLLSGPVCSDQVMRAAVFRGMITTESRGQTEDIFCALKSWQENSPLVLVNGDLLLVDQGCSVELESLDNRECSGTTPPLISMELLPIVIGAAAGGVALLLVVVLVICACCCCFCCSSKKSKDLKALQSAQNSNYERTSHACADSATLTRYTDRINPEPRTPLGLCTSDDGGDHVYSTLNRSEMESYPAPPPLVHPESELDILRKDSRSLLLAEDLVDGKGANQPFQIVQDSLPPEPYERAVSSRENLYMGGDVSEGSGQFPHVASSSTTGSVTSSQLMKLGHALSHSAVPSPTSSSSFSAQRNPSAVNPLSAVSDYEQIDRKGEFSKSSPRLFIGPGAGSTRGDTLPTRVASSGHVRGIGQDRVLGQDRGIGQQDRRLKRHLSATDNAPTRDDYSQLNRGQTSQRHGFQYPPPVGTRNQRGQSVSSVFTTTPTSSAPPPQQQFPLTRLGKRNSVTNYSHGSPSPTDSQDSSLVMRPPCTPTSEAPPPYRSNPSSPYSPSGSSMCDNGAYEGVNPPQAVVVHEAVKSDDTVLELEQSRPWYQQNDSDFSLDRNPPQRGGTQGGGVIAPYSTVSNSEIDSRRAQESNSRRVPSLPRFSISNNRSAAPYTEPVSSVENLSRVHQTTNHLHTVVV